MNTNTYDQDLAIDPDALDVEWLRQPARFMRYCELSAKARADVDRAKQNLDVIKATCDQAIRKNPAKYGLDKITEATVQSALFIDQSYKDGVTLLIQAQYEADLLAGAVRAFDQRKSALEGLVKLQGQGYFAAPSVPHDLALEARKRGGEAAVVNRIREHAAASRPVPPQEQEEAPQEYRRRSRVTERGSDRV